MTTLRFTSQGDWEVEDLHVFLHQLNVLYNRLYVINDLCETRAREFVDNKKIHNMLNRSLSRVPNERRLCIDYIEIHSPGNFGLKVKIDIEAEINIDINKITREIQILLNRCSKNLSTEIINHAVKQTLESFGVPNEAQDYIVKQIAGPIKKLFDAVKKNDLKILSEDEDDE